MVMCINSIEFKRCCLIVDLRYVHARKLNHRLDYIAVTLSVNMQLTDIKH